MLCLDLEHVLLLQEPSDVVEDPSPLGQLVRKRRLVLDDPHGRGVDEHPANLGEWHAGTAKQPDQCRLAQLLEAVEAVAGVRIDAGSGSKPFSS